MYFVSELQKNSTLIQSQGNNSMTAASLAIWLRGQKFHQYLFNTTHNRQNSVSYSLLFGSGMDFEFKIPFSAELYK